MERSFRFDYQNHLDESFEPQAIFLILSIILYVTFVYFNKFHNFTLQ